MPVAMSGAGRIQDGLGPIMVTMIRGKMLSALKKNRSL